MDAPRRHRHYHSCGNSFLQRHVLVKNLHQHRHALLGSSTSAATKLGGETATCRREQCISCGLTHVLFVSLSSQYPATLLHNNCTAQASLHLWSNSPDHEVFGFSDLAQKVPYSRSGKVNLHVVWLVLCTCTGEAQSRCTCDVY